MITEVFSEKNRFPGGFWAKNRFSRPWETNRVCQKVRQQPVIIYFSVYCSPCRAKTAVRLSLIPSILEPEGSSREYRKNWARRRVLPEIMRLTYAVMQRNMVPFIYALEAT